MLSHLQRRAVLMGLALHLVCFAGAQAQAQQSAVGSYGRVEQTNSNIGYYHYYTQPGGVTVQVQVLGVVGATGVYELNVGTSLGTLLTLAGGPQISTRERRNRRDILLRLYRPSEGREAPLFEATFVSLLADPQASPPLRDGDVLLVEVVEYKRFNWRDAATLAGTAAALTLALERVISLTNE